MRSNQELMLCRAVLRGDLNTARNLCLGIVSTKKDGKVQTEQWQRLHKESTTGLLKNLPACLQVVKPACGFDDLYLTEAVYRRIARFAEEANHAEALQAHGIQPRTRMLLCGPTGNGKTSVAHALGTLMDLPIVILHTPKVVDSYMGHTSKNLSAAAEALQGIKCLVFMDEVDSLASVRTTNSDDSAATERALATNTLLTTMLSLPFPTYVVGATNRLNVIDRAALRRWQLLIKLDAPTRPDINAFLQKQYPAYADHWDASVNDPNWAEVVMWCHGATRERVIHNTTTANACHQSTNDLLADRAIKEMQLCDS